MYHIVLTLLRWFTRILNYVLHFMVDGNVCHGQPFFCYRPFFFPCSGGQVQQSQTTNENAYILHFYNLIPFFVPLYYLQSHNDLFDDQISEYFLAFGMSPLSFKDNVAGCFILCQSQHYSLSQRSTVLKITMLATLYSQCGGQVTVAW